MPASEIHKSHRKLHYSHSKQVHAETTQCHTFPPFRTIPPCSRPPSARSSAASAKWTPCYRSARPATPCAVHPVVLSWWRLRTWRRPRWRGEWVGAVWGDEPRKMGVSARKNGDESMKVIQNGHGNGEKLDKDGEIHQRNLKVWATYCKMAQKGKSLTLGFEWILQRTIRRVDRLAANLVVQPTKMAGRRTQWLNHVKSVWVFHLVKYPSIDQPRTGVSDPVAHQWVD